MVSTLKESILEQEQVELASSSVWAFVLGQIKGLCCSPP